VDHDGPRTADRLGGATRLVLPALVAAAIQLAGSVGAASHQPQTRPLDPVAVALLLAGPVALLARQRWPMATVAATAAALLTYLALGYPYGPVVVSFAFALLSAVILGRRRSAWVLAGLTYLGLLATVWFRQGPPSGWVLSGVGAWLLVLLTVAELARARRDRLARDRRARAEAAERSATEERLRIARDLHDVLAHHVSLINVQAGTALHLLDSQPGVARDALTAIKASSKEVLVELRTMLGVLRRVDEQAPRGPVAGLAGLDELAARMRGGGLPVTVRRIGAARPLPLAVDTAAFRIAQESLTNVHRHAGASAATVLVDYSGTAVVVQVDDDGRARPGPRGAPGDGPVVGNGIPGMRERAAALGGRLAAGPRPDGGFRVRAELPVPTGGGSAEEAR
jgi:signal transduction histidine kinase